MANKIEQKLKKQLKQKLRQKEQTKRQKEIKAKKERNEEKEQSSDFEIIQKKSVLDKYYAKYEEDYEKARKQNAKYGYEMNQKKWTKFQFLSEMMQEGDYQSSKNKKFSLINTYKEVVDIAQYYHSLKQDTAAWNRLVKMGLNKDLSFEEFRAQGKTNIYHELKDEEVNKRIVARMHELGRELSKQELKDLTKLVVKEFSAEWFES